MNALKPAEINRIDLFPENGKALVIVDEDQLSLAIGKKGANVRLAAKLCGWDIDIMTEDEAKNKGLLEEGGAAPEGDVTYVEDKGDSASVTESGRLSSGTAPSPPEPEAAPDPLKPAPVQPPAVPVAPRQTMCA